MIDALWQRLKQGVPGLALNGHPTERLPNTLNVRFPSVAGSAVLAETPEVAASTGSACHDQGESPSAILTAMGRHVLRKLDITSRIAAAALVVRQHLVA